MNRFFLTLYNLLERHTKAVWLAVLALMALCTALALRMDYSEDIAAFLPANDEARRYAAVYNHLGGQGRMAVLFRADPAVPGDTELLQQAMEAFGQRLGQADSTHLLHNVQVQADEDQYLTLYDHVLQHYPLLLDEADRQQASQLLTTPGAIAGIMEQNRRSLLLPTAGMLTQSLPTDPLHLSAPLLQRLQQMAGAAGHFRLVDGYLFTDDGQVGVVLAESPYGLSETRMNARIDDLLSNVSQQVMDSIPQVRVSCIGGPLIAVGNARQIKHDSLLAMSLSVLLIFGLLYYSFRRVSYLGWIALALAFGWLFAMGLLSLCCPHVSLIVIGIGSVIIGIAVNYPLHFLGHLDECPDRRQLLRQMAPPLLIGNVTTVSAFLCLAFLDAPAMRHLGLFASFMLVGTILFVLVVMPVLVPARGQGTVQPAPLLPRRLHLAWPRHRRVVGVAVLLLTAVLGVFSLRTTFNGDMRRINYLTDTQRADLEVFTRAMAGTDGLTTLFAVTEGDGLDAALESTERWLPAIRGQQAVRQVSTLATLLVSGSLAAVRTAQWQALWHHAPTALDTLVATARQQGFSATAFAPFLAMTHHGPVLQGMVANADEVLHTVGHNFVMTDSLTRRVWLINLVQTPADSAAAVKERLRASSPAGAFVFDADDMSHNLVDLLSADFNYIGLVCGFVVFFFLWLSFRRIELALLSFLPLAVSWVWILGFMGLCGLQFNIVNIILATFIFGQGDDYTIFITEGLMYEYATGRKTLSSYRHSVALSALIMFFGIGTLALSQHPALLSLAHVAILGMATVVLMAFYLPPLVFHWLTYSGGQRRQVPLTLGRLARSVFSLLFFVIGSVCFLIPYSWLLFHVGGCTEAKRLHYHRLLQRLSRFIIYRVPGTRFSLDNSVGEDFSRPAVIIANHQSHLDLMCILMLSPKVVLLTNDWVWNNWFYRKFIKYAEFYPVSDGFEHTCTRIRALVSRGYSVCIFPEGTRSPDFRVHRFHQGAFHLATTLGLDVLPVYLHGVGHVLPKLDFMLRRGSMHVQVGTRIPAARLAAGTPLQATRQVHAQFVTHYNELCADREDEAYRTMFRRYADMYKGTFAAEV